MSADPILLSFDIIGIKAHQRNRYPVLLIDKITEAIPGHSARGVKCFTYNEWFFPSHFEDEPNVPGFVQIECLTQTFIMSFLCMDQYRGMKTNFASINNVKFKRKIIPGDVLVVDAKLHSLKRGIAQGSVSASVEGELTCSADLVVVIPDVLASFKPKEKSNLEGH
jgi:3-hydroxyacyl-[acyl-carrier-protein] dehydratase